MLNLSRLEDLADRWREESRILRRRGAPGRARLLEEVAKDLEEGLRAWQLEALTLQEAAEEAGISYGGADKRVRRGEWKTVSGPGPRRVRRHQVLGRPRPGPTTDQGEPDVAEKVLRARTEGGR